ncbi:MAG: hypothetical protein ABW174_06190 [Flavitalea sp.]
MNKRIAIVSYDADRTRLVEWSYFNRKNLSSHTIIANNATAGVLEGTLNTHVVHLDVHTFGGYRQLATLIDEQQIDILICIGDATPDAVNLAGVQELCKLGTERGIIVAPNEATANFILHSLPGSVCTHVTGYQSERAVNNDPFAGEDHIEIEFLAN